MIFMDKYATKLDQELSKLVFDVSMDRKGGNKKEVKWDTFWQGWNRLFNAKMYYELNIYFISNYDPEWNRGGGL